MHILMEDMNDMLYCQYFQLVCMGQAADAWQCLLVFCARHARNSNVGLGISKANSSVGLGISKASAPLVFMSLNPNIRHLQVR